jgi:hypothetical protein
MTATKASVTHAAPEVIALRRAHWQQLQSWLAQHQPRCSLKINRNRKTMLSMRGSPHGQVVVSLHVSLLDDAQLIPHLTHWIHTRGRVMPAYLRDAVQQTWQTQHRKIMTHERAQFPALPAPQRPLDLIAALDHVHGTWFSDLPKPALVWGKNPGTRALRAIRFGSYRAKPMPLITLHPRLNRDFVPWIFIEYIIFHELCHHRQACQPLRGERVHGARFHAWESAYPQFELAKTWERLFLDEMLRG